jgi:hypothetical protein
MEIEELFKDFTVYGEKIPVARVKYTGIAEKYVVYTEIDRSAGYFADGTDNEAVAEYDFDVYVHGGSFAAILKAVKKKLKAAGYVWQGDSADMYEEDTGFLHKATTFAKEILTEE